MDNLDRLKQGLSKEQYDEWMRAYTKEYFK